MHNGKYNDGMLYINCNLTNTVTHELGRSDLNGAVNIIAGANVLYSALWKIRDRATAAVILR